MELHGWFDDDTKVFLAMEYFKHGDLQNFMESPFSERDVGIVTRQLLEGLNVMHKHGFTHRDLKPQVSPLSYPFKLSLIPLPCPYRIYRTLSLL